jgi:hypothetical protein
MTELHLLDDVVPRFDDPPDWEDVLRRARPARGRGLLVVTVILAAVVAGAALAVVMTRDARATLPPGADRAGVVAIVEPRTGRIVVQAAPWKAHDGICYVLFWLHAACVPRTPRGTAVLTPPLAGYTFDPRVVSATAVTFSGKHVHLLVRRFGGRIATTFFLTRGRLPRLIRSVVLRDGRGRVVERVAVRRR